MLLFLFFNTSFKNNNDLKSVSIVYNGLSDAVF